MTIVVCDDNLSEAKHITELIHDYGIHIRLVTHTTPRDTIAYLNTHTAVDLCILDIIMPDISGVELAQELRNGGYTGEIVFLTSSNNFAFESYEVKAFRYILKPYTKEQLFQVLHEVENKIKAEDNTGIMIKTQEETRFVPHREIMYAEAQLRKVTLHLENGLTLDFFAKFGDVSKELENDRRFIRCHRSYIANMDYVSSIAGKTVELHGGASIPISSTYSDVKSRYMHFVLGEFND